MALANTAWCFADGVVQFSPTQPEGALVISMCPQGLSTKMWRPLVERMCRRDTDGGLFVPGAFYRQSPQDVCVCNRGGAVVRAEHSRRDGGAVTKQREPYELPCDLCSTLTRVDFLKRVEGVFVRRACPACVEKIAAEEREERAIEDFDQRQVG